MKKVAALAAIFALLPLIGCSTGEVGKSQIDQAYPSQSEDDVRATLAKENPEALKEYDKAQARDRAVEAQNAQMNGGNPAGQR